MSFEDSEIELAKILCSFKRKNKPNIQQVLYQSEPNDIERFMPFDTEIRLKRSLKENISLISSEMISSLSSRTFQVKGSTGKIYTVKIGPGLDCNCQDRTMRNIHCKHILYILVQELKVNDLKSKIFTTLNPPKEVLEQIFIKYHA